MNLRSCSIICTGILALFIASPARANHVDRPASGHGVDNTCSINEPCQTFGTPFTASDGLSVTPYTYNDGTGFNYLDIFAVPGISAGTTVSFAFPALATPADGQSAPFLPAILVSVPYRSWHSRGCERQCRSLHFVHGYTRLSVFRRLSLNPTGPVTSWAFSSNGGVSTWWSYALATGPTSAGVSIYLPTSVTVTGGSNTVPEPGSLSLLRFAESWALPYCGGARRTRSFHTKKCNLVRTRPPRLRRKIGAAPRQLPPDCSME